MNSKSRGVILPCWGGEAKQLYHTSLKWQFVKANQESKHFQACYNASNHKK